jgi:hypothetical protein
VTQGFEVLFGNFIINVEIFTNQLTSTSRKIGTPTSHQAVHRPTPPSGRDPPSTQSSTSMSLAPELTTAFELTRARTLLAPPGSRAPIAITASRCHCCNASWGWHCRSCCIPPAIATTAALRTRQGISYLESPSSSLDSGWLHHSHRDVGLSGRTPCSYQDALLGGLASPDVQVASKVMDHKQNRWLRYRRRKQHCGLNLAWFMTMNYYEDAHRSGNQWKHKGDTRVLDRFRPPRG